MNHGQRFDCESLGQTYVGSDRPGEQHRGYQFGKDPARQRALSPTLHAAAPNVARWLILPIEKRTDSGPQSQQLAAALTKAGARARVVPVPDKSHRALNMGLGEAGDFATGEVDRFLADAG